MTENNDELFDEVEFEVEYDANEEFAELDGEELDELSK